MPVLTTTFDALLRRTVVVTTTFDAYLSRTLSTTFDALVVDARGSFRGTMSAALRDALVAKQPGDTVIVTDETTHRTEHQFWTGSVWIKAERIQAPESGAE